MGYPGRDLEHPYHIQEFDAFGLSLSLPYL